MQAPGSWAHAAQNGNLERREQVMKGNESSGEQVTHEEVGSLLQQLLQHVRAYLRTQQRTYSAGRGSASLLAVLVLKYLTLGTKISLI